MAYQSINNELIYDQLENLFLSHKDNKKNISVPFKLLSSAKKLRIFFNYAPSHSDDAIAKAQVEEGFKKYSLEDYKDEKIEDYLPIENFITLSLSFNGEYLGSHHNKAKQQEIVVTAEEASLGFKPTEIAAGDWELQLNCHCIASEHVQAEIKIEVL